MRNSPNLAGVQKIHNIADGVPNSRRRAAPRKPGSKRVPSLELYQNEACPYSHSVRNELSRLGLDFIAHSVTDNPLSHERLVQAGGPAGKDQYPFLIDHRTGIKLYESSAIVAYLVNEYGPAEPGRPVSHVRRQIQDRVRGRIETLRWIARGLLRPFGRKAA